MKKNSITGWSWSSAKLFLMQNYTDNAKGDVPLSQQEMCDIFNFLWDQGAHKFLERKTDLILSIVFFVRNIFIEFSVLKLVFMTII